MITAEISRTGIVSRNLEHYKHIHATQRYGESANKRLAFIEPWVAKLLPAAMLDYGCGSTRIGTVLEEKYGTRSFLFDPAIPAVDKIPDEFFDFDYNLRMILCSHVLEHLDPAELVLALEHIKQLAPTALIIVPTRAARMILPNGENAHSIVKDAKWWQVQVEKIFPEVMVVPSSRPNELSLLTKKLTLTQEQRRHNVGINRGTIGVHVMSKRRRAKIRPTPKRTTRPDFTGKRVALVGRAANLFGKGMGVLIDSYDLVVRVNERLPLNPSWVKDVGSRTSMLYNNGGRQKVLSHSAAIHGVHAEKYDVAFRAKNSTPNGHTPFTGTVAILQLLEWGVKELYVCGMDLYAGKANYSGGGHLQLRGKRSYAFHDPNRDKVLLKELLEKDSRFVPDERLMEILMSPNSIEHFAGLKPPR